MKVVRNGLSRSSPQMKSIPGKLLQRMQGDCRHYSPTARYGRIERNKMEFFSVLLPRLSVVWVSCFQEHQNKGAIASYVKHCNYWRGSVWTLNRGASSR